VKTYATLISRSKAEWLLPYYVQNDHSGVWLLSYNRQIMSPDSQLCYNPGTYYWSLYFLLGCGTPACFTRGASADGGWRRIARSG
jgi:hypothetical protein